MTINSSLQVLKIGQSSFSLSYFRTVRFSTVKIFIFFAPYLFLAFGSDTFSSVVYSLCPGVKRFLNTREHSVKDQMYQEFCVTPYLWTVFHIAAIEHNNRIFNPNFGYSSFKVPLLLDYFSKTPLHYLAAHSNLDYLSINFMLQYIVEYLEDKSSRTYYEIEQVLLSLSSLFKFILNKANPKLKDRYLSLYYQPSRSTSPLPQFGDAETRYLFSRIPVVDQLIQKEIHAPGQEGVRFRTVLLYTDYDVRSDHMFKTALILTSISTEETFQVSAIAKIIDHLWDETRPTIILSCVFYSCTITLFSVYIAFAQRSLLMEVTIICLAALSLAGEGLQAATLKSNYFSGIFNVLDIAYPVLMIVFIAMRMADSDDYLTEEWISSVAIILGYLRWISYLRLFKTTSKPLFK